MIVTEGLLGDILSDLAAGRAGSPALCGSASIHPGAPARGRCQGLFEPAHGSAPRRAGRNQVNPLGGFLALVALLQHFAETRDLGARLRTATHTVLREGPWTYDLAPEGVPPATTSEVADAVLAVFESGPDRRGAGTGPGSKPSRWCGARRARARRAPRVVDREVLEAVGVRPAHARDVARVLAYADLSGIDSHGIARLPAYVGAIGNGVIAVDGTRRCTPTAARSRSSTGRNLLGHPVTMLATDEAIDRARRFGIGWVNVRGSSHHGASGFYVYEAALQGLVGLAATNTGPSWRRPGPPAPTSAPTRWPSACRWPVRSRWCSTWRPPRSPAASSRSRYGWASRSRSAGA